MASTTTRLGLKVIDTPATDTVDQLRLSINNHATILDAQFIESTYAARPAAAQPGRVHRSTDTGEVAFDTGSEWEPVWGPPSLSRQVRDVGQVGQTRAGRQLSVSDFTDCGLSAPIALYNLGSTADASGNGRTLSNKGSVTFAVGVEGVASTAAVFTGSTGQALYVADTGSNDPFRIRTGTVAGWHRSAKRGMTNTIAAKCGVNTSTNNSYLLQANANNVARLYISKDGGSTNIAVADGVTDVNDDRWHFIVGTYDGVMARIYVNCVLEQSVSMVGGAGPINPSAEPFNIGAHDADGAQAGVNPHFGRIDEVFITGEVLSLDQIRHLYGVKLAHGMTAQPRRASLRVTRRRRGAELANGDFPSNPARAYNLAAGAYTDLNGGAALSASGSPVVMAGPDGQKDSAVNLSGSAFLQATDTGLPSGTADRSYGAWFSTVSASAQNVISWATNGARLVVTATGLVQSESGSGPDLMTGVFVADGLWHHAVVVETNSPVDGLKRKLYLNGALVATSTTLGSITLAGANGLRVGANSAGTSTLQGSVSRAFVGAFALTSDQVAALYSKAATAGVQKQSPKDAADHIEGMWASSLIFIGDDLEPQHLIDLEVSR